ncbi:hypothetical protein ACWEN3_13575 [Streptomyces sp. NPDC004561]
MSDRTTDSGDERSPTGRSASAPDDEWAPEDAVSEERPGRQPTPGERLPGEPGADRSPDASGEAVAQARVRRLPGTVGPGGEGPAADDRTPREPDRQHGTEGLRPGTEDLGTPDTASAAGRTGTGAPGVDGHAGMREASTGAGGERDLGTSAPGPDTLAQEDPMPEDGLGAPSPGDVTGREAGTTETTGTDAWPAPPAGGRSAATGEAVDAPSGTGAPLLPHEETDRWEQRIRQVTAGFVDEPRGAVEEADRALEEIAARFGEAVTRRRRSLRMSWEGTEGRGSGAETDTEQLRLALRDYRELAGRLLHL